MAQSDDEGLDKLNNQLYAENRQLKEDLEALKKKYEMCEVEVKTLLRKIVKLFEEKIERLGQDLTFLQS